MRVVDGKGGSRFIVQILPYGFEDKKPFGYVILIQTVEKKGEQRNEGRKQRRKQGK